MGSCEELVHNMSRDRLVLETSKVLRKGLDIV